MKKKWMGALLSATMVASLFAGCGKTTGSTQGESVQKTSIGTDNSSQGNVVTDDFTGKDPQLSKKIKILTIWAEDNDNGILLNKICEDYKKNVNPNFEWEYEMVSSDNLQQKIATLVASNDLPDLFAYEAGAPLVTLIDSDKVVNISDELERIGVTSYLNEGAVELLKGLSGTDDLYDLPLGLNVEGFWYNKELFQQAGCDVPTTWDEFEEVLEKLNAAGIQPLITG